MHNQHPTTYNLNQSLHKLSLNANQQVLSVLSTKDIYLYKLIDNKYLQPYNNNNIISLNTTNNSIFTNIAFNTHIQSIDYLLCSLNNGSIYLYNINKNTKKPERIIENIHDRSINRIIWHPAYNNLFYTAAQDGVIKQYDIRINNKHAQTIIYNDTIAVRNIKVNPINTYILGAAYDNGIVQIYDLRQKQPTNKLYTIHAHQQHCLTIDWHPLDSDILVTGGNDRQIKVWNIIDSNNENVNTNAQHTTQNRITTTDILHPKHIINTSNNINNVLWRNNCAYQIAHTSSIHDNAIHIYNVLNPYIPLCTTIQHNDIITDFCFINNNNNDIIITCSKDSNIRLINLVDNCIIPSQHMNTTSISFNVYNNIAHIYDNVDRNSLILQHNPIHLTKHNFKFIQYDNEYTYIGLSTIEKQRKSIVNIRNILHRTYNNCKLNQYDEIIQLHKTYKYIIINHNNTLYDICIHNANAAQYIDRLDIAHIWKVIAMLFKHNINHNNNNIQQQQIVSNVTNDNKQQQQSFNNNIQHARSSSSKHILFNALPIISHIKSIRSNIIYNKQFRSQLIHSILQQNTVRDNIQLNCYIIIVCSQYIDITDIQIQQYCYTYIEYLQRIQQYDLANEMINATPNKQINDINNKSTTYNIQCNKCKKTIENNGSYCNNCNIYLPQCVLCEKIVNGLYYYCQICNHGYHLTCSTEWFNYNKQYYCATGCGHKCSYST